MNTPPLAIQIVINGDIRTIPPGQPLDALLADLGLPPQAALIEYNGTALLREEWSNVHLTEGDKLEVLRVVAGG